MMVAVAMPMPAVSAEIQPAAKPPLPKSKDPRPTDICRHWARGFCNRGVSCGFAHTGPCPTPAEGKKEPVEKSNVACKDYSAGKCNRGDRCKFSHIGQAPKRDTPSCRDWAAGTCTRGDTCKYKHDRAPPSRTTSASSLVAMSTPPQPMLQRSGSVASSILTTEDSVQYVNAAPSYAQCPILTTSMFNMPGHPSVQTVCQPTNQLCQQTIQQPMNNFIVCSEMPMWQPQTMHYQVPLQPSQANEIGMQKVEAKPSQLCSETLLQQQEHTMAYPCGTQVAGAVVVDNGSPTTASSSSHPALTYGSDTPHSAPSLERTGLVMQHQPYA